MQKNNNLEVCRFLNDAACAYSITYDEGFVEVLVNALPIHEKYGIPGHVDVVVGQLGQRRNCFRSSMNGYFHMGVEHLKFLIEQGWSVGNHSYSHYCWPDQPGLDMYREIVHSKFLLEDQLEAPITQFTIPNGNYNYEPALPYVQQAGYLGCQGVDGGVNDDDVDLLNFGNFMVASGPICPRDGWPDVLKTATISAADLRGGWLCETTHQVAPNVNQQHKNITPEDLDSRFKRILAITSGDVWLAVPEDVTDYILMRRHTAITPIDADSYTVNCSNIPVGVRRRQLTLRLARRVTEVTCTGCSVRDLHSGKTSLVTVDFQNLPAAGGTLHVPRQP